CAWRHSFALCQDPLVRGPVPRSPRARRRPTSSRARLRLPIAITRRGRLQQLFHRPPPLSLSQSRAWSPRPARQNGGSRKAQARTQRRILLPPRPTPPANADPWSTRSRCPTTVVREGCPVEETRGLSCRRYVGAI